MHNDFPKMKGEGGVKGRLKNSSILEAPLVA